MASADKGQLRVNVALACAAFMVCLLAVATFLCGDASGGEKAPKLNIAIIQLRSENVKQGEADVAVELLRSFLSQRPGLTMIEKRHMDKIIAEQAFQRTGCTDTECAVKIGKILNVQRMGVGSFGLFLKEYRMSIRIVDVETAEAIYSDHCRSASLDNLEDEIRKLAKRIADFLLGYEEPDADRDMKGPEPAKRAPAPVSKPEKAPTRNIEAMRSPDAILPVGNNLGQGVRRGDITRLDFSPDGKQLAGGDEMGRIIIWDAITGQMIHTFIAHAAAVLSVDYAKDGSELLTAGGDGMAKVWDMISYGLRKRIYPSKGERGYCTMTAAYSRDGEMINILHKIGFDGFTWKSIAIDVRDCRSGNLILAHITENDRYYRGRGDAACVDFDKETKSIRLRPRPFPAWGHPKGPIACAEYSPDGELVLTGDEAGMAILWNRQDRRIIKEFVGYKHSGWERNELAFSDDGTKIAIYCDDWTIQIWHLSPNIAK